MTSKRSSRKQFNAMFLQSLRKTCFFPIAAFLCLIFETFIEHTMAKGQSNSTLGLTKTGFFWEDYITGPYSSIAIAAFILAGIINALILYRFVSSKKQNNVIFSFGMSRNDIFISRFIAGIVPMLISIVVAALFELINVSTLNYAVNSHLIIVMVFMVLSFFTAYALSFCLTCAVLSNCGNLFEGIVFTAIIGIFPSVIEYFFNYIFTSYTLGAVFNGFKGNWFNPFASGYSFAQTHGEYFSLVEKGQTPDVLTVLDFSGMIEGLILSAILFAIGLITFNKHKNEISSSWGRAKGLNELCAALVGLYAFTIVMIIQKQSSGSGEGNFGSFAINFLAFLIVYFIFKLIFSSKRKLVIISSLKRSPAYLLGFAAITLIFSTGLFGYSSYIPNTEDVKYVSVSSQLWAYEAVNDDFTAYGLNSSTVYKNPISYKSTVFTDTSDMELFEKVHESIIDDGKIKNKASNSCGNALSVEYTLKSGKTVRRFYSETTVGTAKKLLALNDSKTVKESIKNAFNKAKDMSSESEDGFQGNENEEYYEYMEKYNFANMFQKQMFIFPKDMKVGHAAGMIDNELFNAILTDILAQSSDQTFYHSASDELGVLSFGLSSNQIMNDSDYIQEDKIYNDDRAYIEDIQGKLIDEDGNARTSWNLCSSDISAFVITKDMKNTIEYLKAHDLMKYMESSVTASDVKSIKLATPSELYNENSRVLPLFNAGYWRQETVKGVVSGYDVDYYYHYFKKINNEITNKTTIQKVLDGSTLYGFCDTNYRIVEITYTDGSIGTQFINSDTYNAIL